MTAMDPSAFVLLAGLCAPLVDAGTARAIVQVESSFHPHAIGIVGGQLLRQPRTAAEAFETARRLQVSGLNFSVGLAQINLHNFERLGLDVQTAFEPCANLRAMQSVLLECYSRARARASTPQHALRKALSCYYSGNLTTGVDQGYTRRVVRAASGQHSPLVPLPIAKKEIT